MREFFRYTFLNVMGMIGISCYILADTFFIAQGLGGNGLTALNLAIPIYSFMHGCGLMLGMGGGARYSVLKSQNRTHDGNKVFTHTLMLGAIFAVIFVLAGIFLSGTISTILGADEATFEMTHTYLKVLMIFSPAFILNNILICFVRNDGTPQLSMLSMLGGSFSNIILDYIFIFPLQMGIFGAILATCMSPIIGLIIMSSYFWRKKNEFQPIKTPVLPQIWGNILSTGVSALITELSSGIVILVFNMIVLKLEGNVGVAAYGVIANVALVVIAIYTGVAQGIQPLLSRYYGMGNIEKMKQMLGYAIKTIITLSIIVYIGIFLNTDWIVTVFNSESDAILQSIAMEGMRLYFIGGFFAGINILLAMYFAATGKEKQGGIISMLRGFILSIPIAFALAWIGKTTGLWLAFPATELAVMLIGIFLALKSRNAK